MNIIQKEALKALDAAFTAAGKAIDETGWSALEHLQIDVSNPDSINDVIDALEATIKS